MNDTLVTIIAIFIAAILMFVFPLMTIADGKRLEEREATA